jgi:hypothetical protein
MNKGEQPAPYRGGRPSRSPAGEPVHSITGAVSPHSDDLDARIRRYLISMSIRVLCVILAIVIHARWHHWSWWIFAVGAVILPYVAVVMANAVDTRGGPGPEPVTPQARYVLPPMATGVGPAAPVDENVVITIHPPERPFDENSSNSDASERTFVTTRPNSLGDSSPSPESPE